MAFSSDLLTVRSQNHYFLERQLFRTSVSNHGQYEQLTGPSRAQVRGQFYAAGEKTVSSPKAFRGFLAVNGVQCGWQPVLQLVRFPNYGCSKNGYPEFGARHPRHALRRLGTVDKVHPSILGGPGLSG